MEGKQRSWIRATLWVGLAGAALLLWIRSGELELRSAESAPPSPPLVLWTPDGGRLDLDEQRGRVVVLNLWASWCGSCRREARTLNRVARELAADPVLVVGLNAEGLAPALLGGVRDEWGIEYPVGTSPSPLTGTALAGEGVVPHTWLIDPSGRVRASRAGLVSSRALLDAVRRLLGESSFASGVGSGGAVGGDAGFDRDRAQQR